MYWCICTYYVLVYMYILCTGVYVHTMYWCICTYYVLVYMYILCTGVYVHTMYWCICTYYVLVYMCILCTGVYVHTIFCFAFGRLGQQVHYVWIYRHPRPGCRYIMYGYIDTPDQDVDTLCMDIWMCV
jgi:hypothetical protein